MNVKKRMTISPITATPDTRHRDAVKLMQEHNIRRLPVLDKNGKLVGIVSESDLLRSAPSEATTLSIHEIYTLLDRLTLKQIMTSPVIAVREDCSLAAAARIMVDEKIGGLPVLRDDELVGIITETDIFKTFVEVLGGGEPGTRIDLSVPDEKGVLATIAEVIAGANGNIVSVTTFHGDDTSHAVLSIKERGADPEALRTALSAVSGVELLELRSAGKNCRIDVG